MVKDARCLVRISPEKVYAPSDQAKLLDQARGLAGSLKGKVINLRVSPIAIEFDLFCSQDADAALFKEAFKVLGRVMTWKRLDLPPITLEPQKTVDEARQFFNEYRFWEVHEVLEGLWKERSGSEKQLIQGLILAAAALVHAQKNETAVVWPMLEDALKRLKDQPSEYYGWNMDRFRDHFARVLASRIIDFPTV